MTDHQTPGAAPVHHSDSNGLAIASLVLGILSVLTAWIPIIGLIAWILAPLGLIFGFLSIGKPSGKGLAIGGLITSGIGLLICILWVIGLGAVVSQAQREGAFDNVPAHADINTDGDTTTITTPDATTTVTTTPNVDGPASDDAAPAEQPGGGAGTPPSN
jgi:hypothetical protein